MTKKEFIKWSDDYRKNKPGFMPKDMGEFWDKVENSHQDIRERLGGISYDVQTFIKADSTKVPQPIIDSYFCYINNLLPGYLKEYDLKTSDFTIDRLPEKHKGISTVKHIMGYAQRKKVSEYCQQDIKYYCDGLSREYVNYLTKKDKMVGWRISTHPYDFAMVGSFVCDGSSCFQHGQMNSDKKYGIGICKDSVIIFAGYENVDGEVKAAGRCFAVLKDEVLYTFNKNGDFRHKDENIILDSAKKILNSSEVVISQKDFKLIGGLTYLSGPQCYTTKKDEKIAKHIEIPIDYSKEHYPNGDPYGWQNTGK